MIVGTFQFHEGPIKTLQPGRMITPAAKFQFHEGPIKTMAAQQNQWNIEQVSIP